VSILRKIVTIVGARPQFIKVAPVSRELRKSYNEILVNTGQHYDYKMAGIFFEELSIPKPDYDLGVGSASHGKQTGEMLTKIEEVLLKEQPDAVLVYGDTNSTVAGALAASKLHIPVFHVEAGLRSFNKKMPEEINRILTDHISEILFAPTSTAIHNLEQEGIISGVFNVGDVMYDAVVYYSELAAEKYQLSSFDVKEKEYILATIHRAENTDDPERLNGIFEALAKLEDIVLLPLHPRTENKLKEFGFDHVLGSENIKIVTPVSYLEMVFLENHAKAVVTDSGGVQKEAYFAKVPCFTLRDQTEWVETVEVGWNTLVNPIQEDLASILSQWTPSEYNEHLYGNGKASVEIVKYIDSFFSSKK